MVLLEINSYLGINGHISGLGSIAAL